ncbi:bifunctional AP-4-A phosphorylase/ADP sulfurylase [Lunasporangiospora selenospora]|uniref:Bifunctional AP-4-A phosphorylase/ADP sulfurylase n=1 Tax=Lunasporangiospora selenospora TaxID=979761 RepID=A0A9P6FV69_9FUNG|nr:bifunctional AP-4-A phosphorylase/ADP sulfurylase [Lunasporangiospora selenospora]
MTLYLRNFDANLTSVYDAALASGELIFTASETVFSKETDLDVEGEICYAPALNKKPLGVLPTVEASNPHPTQDSGLSNSVVVEVVKSNPFLPHSPGLYVTDASDDHKILLNKFCITPRHFLVVTKEFHQQTEPLSPEDMLAVWNTLAAVKNPENALAFYNCGAKSGASQPHKHLQVIPLEDRPAPIVNLVRQLSERKRGQRGKLPGDIFSVPINCINHVILLPDPSTYGTLSKGLEEVLTEAYIKLMDAMMFSIREYSEQETLSEEDRDLCFAIGSISAFAYNWILTREFMMIVPRKKDTATLTNLSSQGASEQGVAGITVELPVNSLGFAGMILTRSEEELELAKQQGVFNTVAQTGFTFNHEISPEAEERRKKEQEAIEKQLGGAFTSSS